MPITDVDKIANYLIKLGSIARSMPPSWKGAGISQPVCGPHGEHIGRLLPGKGLYLDCDAKYLGIKGNLPNVIQCSYMKRLLDKFLADENGAITNLSQIKNLINNGNGQTFTAWKYSQITAIDADYFSLFQLINELGLSGTFPAAPGVALDQTSMGALNPAMFNPTGSESSYLLQMGINTDSGVDNFMFIVDMLVVVAIDFTTTALQTLNTVTLPRYTNGAGVVMSIESVVLSDISTPNATVNYTNQNGSSSSSVSTVQPWILDAEFINQSMFCMSDPTHTYKLPWIPLPANDYGIQQLNSLQIPATTGSIGTSGSGGIILYYPLSMIALTATINDWQEIDFYALSYGLVPIAQTSGGNLGCLNAILFQSNNVVSGPMKINFKAVWG